MSDLFKIVNENGLYSDGNLYVKWSKNGRVFDKLDLDLHLNNVLTRRKNNPYLNCKIVSYTPVLSQMVDTYSRLNGLVTPSVDVEPPRAEDTVPVHSE